MGEGTIVYWNEKEMTLSNKAARRHKKEGRDERGPGWGREPLIGRWKWVNNFAEEGLKMAKFWQMSFGLKVA